MNNCSDDWLKAEYIREASQIESDISGRLALIQDEMDRRFGDLRYNTDVNQKALDSRLQEMNEFRNSLRYQQQSFVGRGEYVVAQQSMIEKIDEVDQRSRVLVSRDEYTASHNALPEKIDQVDTRVISDASRTQGATALKTDNRLTQAQILQIIVALAAVATLIILVIAQKHV